MTVVTSVFPHELLHSRSYFGHNIVNIMLIMSNKGDKNLFGSVTKAMHVSQLYPRCYL